MTERVKNLREQSLRARPTISLERARLLTEFYQSGAADGLSIPVARALALKYLLEHKALCINKGELVVGERGPAPKATPTYPEICTHTLEDFDILDKREKVSFAVDDDARRIQETIIQPFWNDRSIRKRLFDQMDRDWIDAYEAGVFTEFQEQRAPGHTVLDDKIYYRGFKDFKTEIETHIEQLDSHRDPNAFDKREQLKAMAITCDAIMRYAERHVEALENRAAQESDSARRAELEEMARICRSVPADKPETFWEALQHYWFVHLGVITELNTWDSFNPGRLDQHLLHFYRKDIEQGRLTEEGARELLKCFWVKFNNQPAPPKVGITAKESATYTDFCLINLGGLTPDGDDGVNELTYVILDVIRDMQILQPSSMVQISRKNPDGLIRKALDIIKTGFGQPSLFNTDAIIAELVRQGKSLVDARCGGASGCVETGAFGKEAYILTGYFNLCKVLEITLHNGLDPGTGKIIGLLTGDPATFKTFDDLYSAFERQLTHFIDIKINGNCVIERLWAEYLPSPFLSVLIDDCVATGRDYNDGGARYNSSYIQGVGIGSITDSLAALKYHVFDKHTLGMESFLKAMNRDFDGDGDLLDRLHDATPKYGNDDLYADDIARRVFESFFACVDGRPNTRGGHFRINLLPTTSHVYFGSVIGALPDGRRAGKPLSEGISPVQGSDRRGPTAVLKSAARLDHLRTGGTLLNQKFTPEIFDTEESTDKVLHLVRTYFRMDGHHIQFNVVSADTLRAAQQSPEDYRGLVVRVAGYSDYFCDLGTDLQNEIIARTEHHS